MDFTHASYLDLLGYIKELGYPIGPFRTFPGSGPYVILRHDIDFSVPKAKEMAELDCEIGVTSTFFVLLTSPYYNALSESNLQTMKEMMEMGHEIGLHYDGTGFENLELSDQHRRIAALIDCLSNNLGVKITAISQHKPAKATIKLEFPEYIDAYSQPFFKEIAYLSDSRMRFGVEDVYGFFKNNPRSQLLIHPILWHSERKTVREVFEYVKAVSFQTIQDAINSDEKSIQEFTRQNRRNNDKRKTGNRTIIKKSEKNKSKIRFTRRYRRPLSSVVSCKINPSSTTCEGIDPSTS